MLLLDNNKKIENLSGRRFGKLEVIGYSHSDNGTYWNCKCDCGTETIASRGHLITKHTVSCGCYLYEAARISDYNKVVSVVASSYKTGAKHRKILFDLTKDQIEELMFQNCYYCGTAPSQSIKRFKEHPIKIKYNGIDRVDNAEGYVASNVVPCCGRCNKMKLTYDIDDFHNHIRKILLKLSDNE